MPCAHRGLSLKAGGCFYVYLWKRKRDVGYFFLPLGDGEQLKIRGGEDKISSKAFHQDVCARLCVCMDVCSLWSIFLQCERYLLISVFDSSINTFLLLFPKLPGCVTSFDRSQLCLAIHVEVWGPFFIYFFALDPHGLGPDKPPTPFPGKRHWFCTVAGQLFDFLLTFLTRVYIVYYIV